MFQSFITYEGKNIFIKTENIYFELEYIHSSVYSICCIDNNGDLIKYDNNIFHIINLETKEILKEYPENKIIIDFNKNYEIRNFETSFFSIFNQHIKIYQYLNNRIEYSTNFSHSNVSSIIKIPDDVVNIDNYLKEISKYYM